MILLASLKLGFSCNNDCIHCVAADDRSVGDMSFDHIKKEIRYYQSYKFVIEILMKLIGD